MRSFLLLLLAAGCEPATTTSGGKETGSDVDVDGDGFVGAEDCDEEDGTVHVDAAELCDGLDNDCDGVVDDEATDAVVFYADGDSDGFGTPAVSVSACAAPEGFVDIAGDCDDASSAYNPSAIEDSCTDPNDYNCDGSVGYADADADGTPACEDCDDGDGNVFPGAVEVCNGADDDCSGSVDDGAVDAITFYEDLDEDGYGTAITTSACEQPAGYALYDGDCDDASAAWHPNASETDCSDPNDYNCDGSVGYADGDADGWAACEECDDGEASHFPGADEYCDGQDDNCDGTVDEAAALDATTWYSDADGDTYGDIATPLVACAQPAAYVVDTDDCDDSDASEFPGAVEICDGDDDDCDAEVDEASASDAAIWYADADTDGYGDPAASQVSCTQPAGWLAAAGDCDDTDDREYPGADERCDGDDDDCDGEVDEDTSVDAETWYADGDGDGFGDAVSTTVACALPTGFVADDTDCDDTTAAVSPLGVELCNLIDDNCDGMVDEGAAGDAVTWYADADADGYGDAESAFVACEMPAGHSATDDDCDDDDSTEHPAADERCDGDDDNCDGLIDEDTAIDVAVWYVDADSDGFGDASLSDVDCDQPAGHVADSTDCEDGDLAVNPGEAEVCDALDVDEDCSGAADDADASAIGQSDGYLDGDADGYGDAEASLAACDLPADYVFDDTDCDDADVAIHPGATEICDAASVDEDCSGLADDDDLGAKGQASFYADADGDDFGDASVGVSVCDQPAGYVVDSSDCDDALEAVYPGAAELCDGLDNDCDAEIDEGVTYVWYADADADGYGDSGISTSACTAPSEYVADGTDCDDAEDTVYPGAPTVCGDLLINDCAGTDSGCELAGSGLVTAVDQAYWYGIGANDNVGVSGAGVGDISGDGADDILFGANQYDPTGLIANAGRAWLYEADSAAGGTELAQSAVGYATFTASSMTNADYLGYQVSAAGHFASAISTAVVIGATNMKVGTFSVAGEAYVFDAPVGSLTKTSASLVVQGRAGSDNVGYDVSGGYDVNDDGLDDVLVGAYGYDTGSSPTVYDGLAGVFFGGSTGTVLITAADAAFTGTAAASDQAGQVLAMVPDISGDGLADLVISAYKSNGASDYGTVYVVHGDAVLVGAALTTAADVTLSGPAVTSAQLGRSVDFAGDITGDGAGDLVVGADGASNGSVASGAAYVFAGPVVSGASTSASITLAGQASGDFFGRSVAGGGDFDGDGNDDIGVTATSADVPASGAGAAGLWYGPLSAGTYASSTADVTFTGMVASDALGASFDFVGDTNADGFDDLLLGATSYDASSSNVGGIFLIRGQGN